MSNEATGLPELPEGQYWEVARDNIGLDQPTWLIRIMRKPAPKYWSSWQYDPFPSLRATSTRTEKRETSNGRTWYGKKKTRHEFRTLITPEPRIIWQRTINFAALQPGPEHIRYAAKASIEELAQHQAAQKLIGKYPPNKLEAP